VEYAANLLLIKQNFIATSPHARYDNIKATRLRLEKKCPPIDSLTPSLLVGFLPPVQTSLQMAARRMSKNHLKSYQDHWTLSLCRLCMNWEIPHVLQHLWH